MEIFSFNLIIKKIALFAEIFGSGFPSEEALNKMWMQQQVIIEGNNSDNLLDYPKAGLSLFKNYVYEAN